MKILAVHLLPILSKLKHPAYTEEHEYRISQLVWSQLKPLPAEKIFWCNNPLEKSPFIRSIPYTIHGFDNNDIVEIWIGSRCNFEHAKNEVEKLLAQFEDTENKIKIKIRKSDIPYRNN